MDLLIEFAKIGLGTACVIRSFVKNELNNNSLVEIPLNLSIPKREVGFVYQKNKTLSKSLEEFLCFCREQKHATV